MTTSEKESYQVGQLVSVQPRTWSGINRPGGVGRITQLHKCPQGYVESVDVKYILGTCSDTRVELDYIQPHSDLPRRARSRKGREFFHAATASPPVCKKPRLHPFNSKSTTVTPSSPVAKTTTNNTVQLTKASTAKPTLPSGGSTALLSSHNHATQPPVAVVAIPHDFVDTVSPLPVPTTQTTTSTKSSSSSSSLLHPHQPPPSDTSYRLQKQHKTTSLAATSNKPRVPLRQVFDHTVNKTKSFVKSVVGRTEEIHKQTTHSSLTAGHEKAVSQCLRQLFSQLGDSVSQTMLASKLQQTMDHNNITSQELERCLQLLSHQGRIMVSEGEIYKI